MNFLISNIQYIHVMAVTILLSWLAMAIRRWRTKEMRWLVLLLLCFIAYIVRVAFESHPFVFLFFNNLFFFTPVIFMLAIQSIFDDEFEIGKLEWGVISAFLVYFCLTLAWRILGYELRGLAYLVIHNFIFSFVAFCVFWTYWRTIQTWSNDLLESRRKLRVFSVVLLGPAIFIGAVLYYIALEHELWTQYTNLFVSSCIIFCGIYSFFTFAEISISQLPIEALDAKDKENSAQGIGHTKQVADQVVDNVEQGYQREIDVLEAIMEVNKRYLECNLNIAKLAEYTKIPEYKLRVAINQVLGHKNFNAYLNTYRIDAAKAMLSNSNNEESITNIALECGYSNQSTFNKAFRKAMHLTPSEFRELAKK